MTRTKESAPFPLNEMPNGRVLGWRFEHRFFISWAPEFYLHDHFLSVQKTPVHLMGANSVEGMGRIATECNGSPQPLRNGIQEHIRRASKRA